MIISVAQGGERAGVFFCNSQLDKIDSGDYYGVQRFAGVGEAIVRKADAAGAKYRVSFIKEAPGPARFTVHVCADAEALDRKLAELEGDGITLPSEVRVAELPEGDDGIPV